MEAAVGIESFLQEGYPFKCIFKHRFTDFIVQEIDLKNQVAVISDKTKWNNTDQKQDQPFQKKDKALPFANLTLSEEFLQQSTQLFGQEVTEQFKQFVEKVKTTGKCVQFETKVPLPESKEDRIKVHQLIRQNIPILESFTKNVHNQKSKAEKKEDKANEKLQEQVLQDHILIKTSTINFKKYVASQTTSKAYGESKKFVKFLLMKRNIDSINAGMFISKQLGLSNKHFAIAGTKDKRGITTQWATLQGMEIGQLIEIQERKFWNSNILMSDYSYQDSGIRLGDLQGNKFCVTLRFLSELTQNQQWELAKNIENLKSYGFVNYFGLQRFGSKSKIKTHQIGKEIIKKNWKECIRLILLSSQQEDEERINQLFELDDFVTMSTLINPKLRIDKQLVDSLLQNGVHNYFTALQSLPRNARELYLHAYQSYIWNRMASMRIKQFGNKIVVGDIVSATILDEGVAEEGEEIVQQVAEDEEQQKNQTISACVLVTEQNISQYTFDQIVLPIYGHKITIPEESIASSLLKEIFQEEQITKQDFEDASNKFFIDGNFRYFVQIPTEVDHQLFKYQNKDQDVVDSFGELIVDQGTYQGLLFRFKLKKSSYATMLIRELTKCPSTLEFQQELSVEFK
ncbi:unnamed protein product (macronuclear) [Paramecium tetraurelia]|uniref:TRUD domain-containing protein n=1 Tax=Paramecium tetraurelia TaxID=5888 RepID=A0BVU8_PARTE|nr:uncharacterized protein GSPATT00032517001 [Paramecium tetraurelia]CAK62665.1 unnamed protein product [Paramecium tetraurelia]|eukprot:XP_001430063.1 hypothetical protein (macronuclear) [Paramecium tetraurelia strain d4-2]